MPKPIVIFGQPSINSILRHSSLSMKHGCLIIIYQKESYLSMDVL
jgi:hypothetical protein